MAYGVLHALASLTLIVFAAIGQGWWWGLLWPALSSGMVASGYFAFGPAIFGKSKDGRHSPIHRLLLLPYRCLLYPLWHLIRLTRRESPFHQLTENLYVGRRLLPHELPSHIVHVIDLTSEFSEPKPLHPTTYHLFPILDASAPPADQLRQWAETATKLTGDTYVHCAAGHGRACLMATAILLQMGHSSTVEEAFQFVKSKRPRVRLNRHQRSVLETMAKSLSVARHSPSPSPIPSP